MAKALDVVDEEKGCMRYVGAPTAVDGRTAE